MAQLTQYVVAYGLPLIFAIVLLEQLGAPIPAIPILIVAGALSMDGNLSAWRVLAVAVVASLIADSLWFLLGRSQGSRILRTLCRISLSPDSCVRQTESVFERWGMPSLLVAKFIPGFSTVAPPMAGATKAGLGQFLGPPCRRGPLPGGLGRRRRNGVPPGDRSGPELPRVDRQHGLALLGRVWSSSSRSSGGSGAASTKCCGWPASRWTTCGA
jgi:membrane protein YqaA with SNARE-associated domain